MKLWENDHSYFCNESNYFAPGTTQTVFEYASWDEFLIAWGDANPDFNLLFRWDWKKDDDDFGRVTENVKMFWLGQRKGNYQCTIVKGVTDKDEARVIEFLLPRWEHLKNLWSGISDRTPI